MEPWDSNIRIISRDYPGLAEQIRKAEGDGELRVETAASGDPTLIFRGLHIHSPRDPAREGARSAQTLSSGGPIVILGFGLGYAAEGAAENAPDRPLLIVERHPAILRKALETRNLGNLLGGRKIVFVIGGEPEGITGALRLMEKLPGGEGLDIIRNRGLINLDESWYGEVERHIGAWTSKDDVNMATLRRFGKRWVRNLAANREAIRDLPGISPLRGILGAGGEESGPEAGDIPVFLAAAGPSLDGLVPFLPEIARRCVVIAVDTSQRLLLGAGVDPDFTLVVDPQYWNARHLDHVPAPGTCLIAESAVYPPVLRHPFQRALLCSSLFPLGRFIEDRVDPKGPLGAGGSVATSAWDFARILGASSIWIAGLDLSFPRLKTHFKGALFEDRSLGEATRFIPAETRSFRALRDGHPFRAPAAGGGQVLTDKRLSLYSAWFENRFRQYPGIRNHSLSPEGLALAGFSPAGPEELLALPERREGINRILGAVFARIEDDFRRPEGAARREERYRAALEALIRGLEHIKALAEQAAEDADRAYRQASPGRTILQKLEEVNRAISASAVKDVAGFLFPPLADLEAGLESPESEPLRRYLELSVRLYRSLAEAAGYNLAVLSKT
ncbi:MAG: DUF115 domain-containing protein [Treponema sp.]|jgi:hypothetical protein|nr:DUF115 domain-containing protein [Treponema sp.]